MIILHRGIGVDDNTYYGYASIESDTAYILTTDGQKRRVSMKSIKPVISENTQEYLDKIVDLTKGGACRVSEIESFEDELGRLPVNQLKCHFGISYIEELEHWTIKEFMKLRGVGKVRAENMANFVRGFLEKKE